MMLSDLLSTVAAEFDSTLASYAAPDHRESWCQSGPVVVTQPHVRSAKCQTSGQEDTIAPLPDHWQWLVFPGTHWNLGQNRRSPVIKNDHALLYPVIAFLPSYISEQPWPNQGWWPCGNPPGCIKCITSWAHHHPFILWIPITRHCAGKRIPSCFIKQINISRGVWFTPCHYGYWCGGPSYDRWRLQLARHLAQQDRWRSGRLA